MPIRERARSRVVLEVAAQPLDLRRLPIRRNRAVQRDDVPRAERVTVIAAPVGAGIVAEVVEVGLRMCGQVVVVAGSWTGPRLVTAPARIVAVPKLRRRS